VATRLTAARRTWTPTALRSFWAAARAKNPSLPETPPGGYNANLFKPWSPWNSSPPAGTYDPALDAAKGAAGRGYGDLQQDVGRDNLRDTVDYGLGREDIIRQGMQSEQDRQTAFAREGEDYNRNVALLSRAFKLKGNVQSQQANQYGVLRGGTLLQAARKRAENEALQRQPMDTAHSRFQADSATQQQRLSEGANTALGRLALMMAPPDASNPMGGRSFQDRTTTLTRAGRENTQFGIDTEAQKGFQAAGTGWDPGVRPKGEYVSPTKGPWRIRDVGGIRYRVDPSGRVLSTTKRPRRRR
jgi:hypothetical protein